MTQRALPRYISDHCPIILHYSSQLWGPKPFSFKNHWLAQCNFSELVHSSLNNFISMGWKTLVLKEKLKSLKGVLKILNKEFFGKLIHHIDTSIILIR